MLRAIVVFGSLISAAEAVTNACAILGERVPIIFDMDGNIDDLVALPYMAKSGVYDIKAVIFTATGFTTGVMGIRNTIKVLEMLGLGDVDVGKGPVYGAYQDGKFPGGCDYSKYIPKTSIDASDGLYGVIEDFLPFSSRLSGPFMAAADVYKKHVDAGTTTVLTLGPLTSLWDFKRKYPDSFAKIKTLYSMFGTINDRGNVFTKPGLPVEFNAAGDPHAAKEVLSADTIQSITLVPLDATNDVPMTPSYMTELASMTTPEGHFVSNLTHQVQNGWFSGPLGFYGWANASGIITPQSEADAYFFWDPLAVAVMIDPSWVNLQEAKIMIVANDPPDHTVDGRTQVDPAGKTMKYAASVSAENAKAVRSHIVKMLNRQCVQDQPLPLRAAMELAQSAMSTCGAMRATYKVQGCCGNPSKPLMLVPS